MLHIRDAQYAVRNTPYAVRKQYTGLPANTQVQYAPSALTPPLSGWDVCASLLLSCCRCLSSIQIAAVAAAA
jgi:hypothetical protein